MKKKILVQLLFVFFAALISFLEIVVFSRDESKKLNESKRKVNYVRK